jgi:hypothetical protein
VSGLAPARGQRASDAEPASGAGAAAAAQLALEL